KATRRNRTRGPRVGRGEPHLAGRHRPLSRRLPGHRLRSIVKGATWWIWWSSDLATSASRSCGRPPAPASGSAGWLATRLSYPGTTEEVVRPILEESGLVAGDDFHLAFSPERIDPGNPVYGVRNTPKIVGGLGPACAHAAAAFYGKFVDQVVQAKGTREAEMA